jgi:hypothetical protein
VLDPLDAIAHGFILREMHGHFFTHLRELIF